MQAIYFQREHWLLYQTMLAAMPSPHIIILYSLGFEALTFALHSTPSLGGCQFSQCEHFTTLQAELLQSLKRVKSTIAKYLLTSNQF